MSKITFEIPAQVVRAASLFLANKFEKREYLRYIGVSDCGTGPAVYASNGHFLFKWPLWEDTYNGFLYLRKDSIFIPTNVLQPVNETATCEFEVDMEQPDKITMSCRENKTTYDTLAVQKSANYENVIPEPEPGGVDTIIFNPRYLANIDEAFKLLDRNASMQFFLRGRLKGTLVKAVEGNEIVEKATIVLMPLNIED